MGGKTILLLLALVSGLVAVLLFTDEKPKVDKVAETMVLDGRELGQCTKIRWQFEGLPAVELGRGPDGRFEIEEPIHDLASIAYLKAIVDAWDSAQMRGVPIDDTPDGRRRAGLSPPELKLIAYWPGESGADSETRMEIEIGGHGPLGDTRFVRRADKIWEADEVLYTALHVGLDDLRERAVFRNAFDRPTSVKVEQQKPAGGTDVLHVALEDGVWHTVAPFAGIADPRAAQRFVVAVVGLRVDYFLTGLVQLPDTPPEIVVTVDGPLGEERLELWQKDGQVYGRLPGRDCNFTSDNRQFGQIFVNAANELRARILVPMGDSTFEELLELIVDPGQGRGDRLRLVRGSAAEPWRMVEPLELAARATPVNEACLALSRLVAREFVADEGVVRPRADDARYGLGTGRWTVSTKRVGEREVDTLWFGADVPGQASPLVYVCRSDEPDNVATVDKDPLTVLQRPWTEYVERTVLKTPQCGRLDLTHGDGRSRTFANEGGTWHLVGDASADQRAAEVGALCNDDLRDLSGSAAVDMRTGFAADPDWRLVLARDNGDPLGEVRVWDRGATQPLVVRGRGEAPVGFELNARLSRELRELWK